MYRQRPHWPRSVVAAFTSGVLLFWANHGSDFPTWALAMRIVGSLTPNSAAAERVFSLLKLMFGEVQMSSLADMIQAALMLRYKVQSMAARWAEARVEREPKVSC